MGVQGSLFHLKINKLVRNNTVSTDYWKAATEPIVSI